MAVPWILVLLEKAWAVTRIMDYMQTQPDVVGMILNLGGSSVMTYGEKPDGSSWKVALTDPRDTEGDYLGAITWTPTSSFPPLVTTKNTS